MEDRYFKYIDKVNKRHNSGKLYIEGNLFPTESIDKTKSFFAYGFLKPDEIGYSIIEEYVKDYKAYTVPKRKLYLKDGLPVALSGNDSISGYLLTFSPDYAELAYRNIAIMTYGGLFYLDRVIESKEYRANMLVLNSNVSKQDEELISLVKSKRREWHSNEDPFFSETMHFLRHYYFEPLFYDRRINHVQSYYSNYIDMSLALQMAYMQLWVIIDRYCTMSCWVKNSKLTEKARMFAAMNQRFIKALEVFDGSFPSKTNKKVYHSCSGKSIIFSVDNIIDYYYNIRCNSVHRGKGTTEREINLVKYAFMELFAIMWAVINDDYCLIERVKNYFIEK